MKPLMIDGVVLDLGACYRERDDVLDVTSTRARLPVMRLERHRLGLCLCDPKTGHPFYLINEEGDYARDARRGRIRAWKSEQHGPGGSGESNVGAECGSTTKASADGRLIYSAGHIGYATRSCRQRSSSLLAFSSTARLAAGTKLGMSL